METHADFALKDVLVDSWNGCECIDINDRRRCGVNEEFRAANYTYLRLHRSEIQETEFIAQAGIASSSDSAMSMPVEPSSDDSRSEQGSLSPLQVFIMI